MIWLSIALMALITFAVRYVFIARAMPIKISPTLQRLLRYSAPAVLTALTIPIVFFPQGELHLRVDSPFLWGAAIAIGLSLTRLPTIIVVVGAISAFALLKFMIFA